MPAADGHHPEVPRRALRQLHQRLDQDAVAGFEHVQRHHQARHQNRAQREERQPDSHSDSLGPARARTRGARSDPGSPCAARSDPPGSDHGPAPRLGTVIRRLDLRGRGCDARALRGVVPRAELDVEHAVERGPADLRGRARARRRGRWSSSPSASTASGWDPSGCRRRPCSARSTGSTRRSAPRWRSRSAGPGWCTATSGAPTTPPEVVARRHASPSAGCRSTGSGCTCPAACAVYPSSVVMNVVPAQVAGVASIAVTSPPQREADGSAGCRTRRSSPRARCSASTRCTPSAAPRRSRCSPTARGTATARGLRAGRPGHRPGQRLRRRGQAAAQGRGRHRRRGRPDRDRDPRRRHRRPRRTSPPT